jgi:hypothetical protein
MQDHTLTTSEYMELPEKETLLLFEAPGLTHHLATYAGWSDLSNTLTAIPTTILHEADFLPKVLIDLDLNHNFN